MLLIDRSNEFRELAKGIGYPTSGKNWELVILNFCFDFSGCFKSWADKDISSDHMQAHKCNTMMRQIAFGKSNMTEVKHLKNQAYRIAEDFKAIYKRIE